MKLHYIGIIKNDVKPGIELVSEKELSAYSRFTRQKYDTLIYPPIFSHPPSTLPFSGLAPSLADEGETGTCRSARTRNTWVAGSEKQESNIVKEVSNPLVYSYGEFMTMFSKTVAERTRPGQRQDVEEQDYTFHAYARSEGVCGIIISDHEYAPLAAHQLLSKVLDDFLASHPKSAWANGQPQTMPELKEYIAKYQDPTQADGIMKIQRELDETKIVLHKTIESVLQRGEKIDDLVAKSDGLSAQSKMFYQQAKKQNSCCLIM